MFRRIGRALGQVVEVVGRTLDTVAGVGVRSRGAAASSDRRREDEVERLTRLHATGRIGDAEFARRRGRIR